MRPTRRPTGRPARLTGLAAAPLVLALLAAGCGGGDDEPDIARPSASGSATSTPSATATAPTSPAGPPRPSIQPSAGFAADYLPVPAGVTLTDPGAVLELGEQAVAAWLPRQDLVGVVELAVTRIEETTVQASLAGFDLDREAQRSTPYFVTTKVTNVGDTDLGARQLPLYFLDDRGVIVAPTGVARDFEACPGSTLPAVFGPGESTRSCLIFLLPERSSLQSVMFRPPEGVVPVRWTGEVSALGEREERDGREGRDRQDRREDRDDRGSAS